MNQPGDEAIPPEDDGVGRAEKPLEIGETGWRNMFKRTGKMSVTAAP